MGVHMVCDADMVIYASLSHVGYSLLDEHLKSIIPVFNRVEMAQKQYHL